MTSDYFASIDWRKQAAMTAVNDVDIEKAFSDQASGFVENKVGDLMKDQHRIGFEIVKKNEDNTRMVGIFAFKVDKSLVFAPVFFINGEIKGPLLYRCDSKTFVPATKEWGNYLVESMELKEGKGRSTARRGDSPPMVRMNRIAFAPMGFGKAASSEQKELVYRLEKIAPGTYRAVRSEGNYNRQPLNNAGENSLGFKYGDGDGTVRVNMTDYTDSLTVDQSEKLKKDASAMIQFGDKNVSFTKSQVAELRDFVFDKEASCEWADIMMDAVSKEASANADILKSMLSEVDFGKAATAAVMGAAERNEQFAARLYEGHGHPDNLLPEKYVFTEKKAEAKPELTIVYDADLLKNASEEVKKEYFAQGFYITDTRPQDRVAKVDEYEDVVSSLNTHGVHSILKDDGSFEEDVLVLIDKTDDSWNSACCHGELAVQQADAKVNEICRRGPRGLAQKGYVYLIKDGKVLRTNSAMGIYTGDTMHFHGAKDTVEAGNAYLAFNKRSGDVKAVFLVDKVNNVDGVQMGTVYVSTPGCTGRSSVEFYKGDWEKKQIIVNKDLDFSNNDELVFGADTRFVKISLKDGDKDAYKAEAKSLEGIGGVKALDNFVMNRFGLPKITITKQDAMGKKAYVLSAFGEQSKPMNRVCALVKLAQDMTISGPDAYNIIKKADANGSTSFVWEPMEKSALRLRLVDQPSFQDEFDTEFGTPVRPTQAFRLRVHGDQTFERPSAIGDAMNPTTPTGLPDMTVANADPESLQGLADLYKLPHVFDHAVVGTLADTFNAMPLVRKYIPRLEEGVDALGRIKFMLHWCPNDFERAYGDDEMVNFESEVDSNFVSQGALLLKLLKKNDVLRENDDVEAANKAKDNN